MRLEHYENPSSYNRAYENYNKAYEKRRENFDRKMTITLITTVFLAALSISLCAPIGIFGLGLPFIAIPLLTGTVIGLTGFCIASKIYNAYTKNESNFR